MIEPLLTAEEAAAYLRVHPVTLRKWAAKGRIPVAGLIGKSYRFDRSDLLRWLGGDVPTGRRANGKAAEE